MGEVKGQGHIVHPVSNGCTSYLFRINRIYHYWDVSNRVFNLEKHIRNYLRKFAKIRVSNKIGDNHDQKNIATKCCSDWLSGFHFILQTSKFLFINITAVTLGPGL